MINVLVTGAGGAAAIGFLREVGSGVYRLFAADIDPNAQGLFLVPENQRLIIRRGADPLFVDSLLRDCEAQGIDVLVPTVECEMAPIMENIKRFSAIGTRVMSSPLEALNHCTDKAKLALACEGIIPLPRTETIDASFDSAGWPLPFVAKPRCASGGTGFVLVQTREQAAALPHDGSLIAQEYLPGEEYSVDVLLTDESKVVAAVPRVRMKVDSGVAVVSRTVRHPELERLATRVAGALGLRYAVNVQFRNNAAGQARLLEINPRFAGTMSLTAAAGVELHRLALEHICGLRLNRYYSFRELGMVRTWQEHYVDPAELAPQERAAS